MKKLLYVLTALCLLAGLFTACEKEEKAKSTIKGVVTDKETGTPLSGVTLELQPTGKQAQTAEDGAYIFENLKAGAYTIKAEKAGYDDYEKTAIQLGVEQTLTIDIILTESTLCVLEGKVTDKKTGSPLSDVTVTLQPGDKQMQTAEDGAYIFENLKAGAYTIRADKDGYDDYENAEIELGVEQTLTLDIILTESSSCVLEGKVTDKKTGSPLSDVTITLQLGDKQIQTTEDGAYIFENLNAGAYTLKAQKEGYMDYVKEKIQLDADQVTTLDVEMEELFVEFQIIDAEGKAIKELECDAPECSFKLSNIGNISGEWSIEYDADWITELRPLSGSIAAGETETIMIKRKLQEEDEEAAIIIKTNNEDLSLKINNKGFVMEMVYVEGGEFEMGPPEEYEVGGWPSHHVTLDGFHIGKYEVTQAQWRAVMGTEPSYFKGDNLPVEEVSWNEAQEFCWKLSEATGKKYVLPTEAQWEYAARGGNKSQHYKYSGGNDIDEVAWYGSNSGSKTHPVGMKKANELGIYDMSGNVWEWCSDWYGAYSDEAMHNPQGPGGGSYRVARGGDYENNGDYYCRVWSRISYHPGGEGVQGFRVVYLP